MILAAILLTGRTLLSVLAGSTWLYLLQPIISDGAVAALSLLSLAIARPMAARPWWGASLTLGAGDV